MRWVQLEKHEMPYWFEPTETTFELGQHTVKIETGRIAKQAAGSVVVSCGGTSVLVTAVHSSPRPGIDFFPLTVDFVEKFAAAGKIPLPPHTNPSKIIAAAKYTYHRRHRI